MSEIITTDNENIIKRIEQQKKEIINQLTKHPNIKRACSKSGIQSTATFYKWCKDDETFKEESYWARQSTIADRLDAIEDSAFKMAVGSEEEGIKPNIIACFGQAKAYSNQSDLRTWSDAPPEPKQEQQDKALPLDATSDKLRNLMQIFVDTLPEAKPIEPASIQTQEKSQE